MPENSDQNTLAIAPPLIILIVIAGAVVAVILFAVIYRLCRSVRANANEDLENQTWNPNKRNPAQDKYMEEVRWRNNAHVWERAKEDKDYRRGWFKDHLERQRDREAVAGWTPGREVSSEEFLTQAVDNPYQELLEERKPAQRESRVSPLEAHRYERGSRVPTTVPYQYQEQDLTENLVRPDPVHGQANNAGVKITMNDESDDIVDQEISTSGKFPPRQSRMFRSSSIYSGDGLLPSNHLHMVQSSSSYALKDSSKASRVQEEIDQWEQRNYVQ